MRLNAHRSLLTSPCKGEVAREAGGRGSASRNTHRLARAAAALTPSPTLPLSGGGSAPSVAHSIGATTDGCLSEFASSFLLSIFSLV